MKFLTSQRLLDQVAKQLYRIAAFRHAKTTKQRAGVQPRRVVHVSPAYFSDTSLIGGGERYVTDLAVAEARYIDTTLVSFGSRRQSLRQGDLKIEVYPALDWLGGVKYDPLNYTFLREIFKADVVHCHQYRVTVTNLAMLAGAALGKAVFVTDYGGVGKHFTESLPLAGLVDGFLPISEFSTRSLPAVDQVRILYGGVPGRFLREAPVEQLGRCVLFVGRLLPHKGVNYLIEAIDSDICLEVVGRSYHEDYFKLLQQLASRKNVKFFTNASDDELMKAYRRALVTVLPSVYCDIYGTQYVMPELLGLVLLESMANGVPVICTDVGSMPEIVIDGVTGFIVPPNDPKALRERISYLYQHPEQARRMGRAGREQVEKMYTWDAVAGRCLSAYGWQEA